MQSLGAQAREASSSLAIASSDQKNTALHAMANWINNDRVEILAANQKDASAGIKNNMAASFLDRLTLNNERIDGIISGLNAIADLDDPVGSIIASWDQPNGLHFERVRTPLGVIGVIYESRPNVTADAGALCLKAGNAVILRGGSDSYHSSRAIHAALQAGLLEAGLPAQCIQIVPTTDRAAVGEMLKGLDGQLDVLVPRGGKSLVSRVQSEARVPVFSHLEGICHLYVHEAADLDMACNLAVNGKMRRTGICGALETLLVDEKIANDILPEIANALIDAGCKLRGDSKSCELVSQMTPANEADWSTEYLDAILSVRIVNGLDHAISHIGEYGSSHTDSIVTGDPAAATEFLNRIDSAIVMHNASTQYADGGEFGMGAEIGIATGRMHARGPVGVEQLTSFKYRVHGTGQTRP
ncbi:MAG: glutamate-5-semialdehyde dehydrogenase [Cohaesibacteraceae bacterium]|nr:glutamate-5-semialdehyde dehydrogenase [Cohaesibacteraceae bacterium]